MKACSRCKTDKEDAEFRIRKETRKGGFTYLNNECKECDKERAAIYYAKMKNDPDFKKKNCERARSYTNRNIEKIKIRKQTKEFLAKHNKWNKDSYHRMKDVINAKMKVKRQTSEYKEMMKNYRAKNKEKIHKQEVITKRRYHEKHRDGLTDEYVIRQLVTQEIADREILKIHPEIIEAKRVQLLIIRQTKKNHENRDNRN
jgi:hypothetical protein